ncbi:MAG TPA: HD domain-containing phosphohydrolase [Candidatus Polarisedimenticolia bacterium]|nr:HD domain-containing phosphohydrolase [Candidatus Polarisedimenticolia bacterium]
MADKILIVDDDSNLLASCERNLRRRFQIETAEGGQLGLEKIAARGPYAVVISDMQMPGMNGVQFLSIVKERAPEIVRVMLTGNADVETAMRVVNEGNIFRFLTKPCVPEVLTKAIDDALAQYRLLVAEKELLNKTLNGSIKMLTEILSIMDTPSFGRSQVLRDMVAEATEKLGIANAWEIHLAVMLAPIGYVTVPPETMLKTRAGEVLSKVEEQMVERLPDTAAKLLANIPRLEGVAKIVRYQQKRFDGGGFPLDTVSGIAIPQGSRLLKIFWDMFQLQKSGLSRVEAIQEMEGRQGWYDPELLASVRTFSGGKLGAGKHFARTMSVSIKQLAPGMILHSNIITRDGVMIIPAGHEINQMTLQKIHNFESVSGIKLPIFVTDPNAGK